MKSFLKHVFRTEHVGFALVLFAASLCRFGCLLIACTSWINSWTPLLVVFGTGFLLFDVGIRWADMALSRSLAIDHMCGIDTDIDKMLAGSEIDVAGTVTHVPPPPTNDDIIRLAGAPVKSPWRHRAPYVADTVFERLSFADQCEIARRVEVGMRPDETLEQAYYRLALGKPAPTVVAQLTEFEQRCLDRQLPTQLDIRAPLSAEELHAVEDLRKQGLATDAAVDAARRRLDDTPEPHPLPAIAGLDPKDAPNAPQ